MEPTQSTLAAAVAGVSLLVAVVSVTWLLLASRRAQGRLRRARETAERLVADARGEADNLRKVATLEGREELFAARAALDRDAERKRQELAENEKRLQERDANLDRKFSLVEKKDADLAALARELESRGRLLTGREAEVSQLVERHTVQLERVSAMSRAEARAELLKGLRDAAEAESLQLVKQIKDDARRDAEREAKKIVALAIQRCAADHVAETTVSVVHLPNEEMKGRIIGREGRNIRAFEAATGIDIIIDDTPESVVLSGFDPIRREIAKLSLEKLIADGRIHPGRIEEVVKKTQAEIAVRIQEIGEEACYEVGIQGLHANLVNLMGRLHYRTSYGQNILKHSKEVSYLAGMMAGELGLDTTLARRGGFLHDVGKALTHETEGSHTQIGYDVARRLGEHPVVLNCIAAHHDDVPHESPISVLVQAADAMSGARPGARRETLEAYVRRLEKLESLADSMPGVFKSYAIQAGRELRVLVVPDEVDDRQANKLSEDLARKIEDGLHYPGQIKVVVIRETRSVEYAR
ncbi:MAG TPA: ribonuclease Y [Gemmatimonadota bacterium]|jgi:ribonuclease Y